MLVVLALLMFYNTGLYIIYTSKLEDENKENMSLPSKLVANLLLHRNIVCDFYYRSDTLFISLYH